MILIKRPAESGHAYEKIWTKDGSPLVVTSKHVQAALQKRVSVPVELAMRYQNPSIESAVKNLAAKGVTDLLLIPLFPHYAMSSYETAVVRVQEVAAKLAPQMKMTVQPPYYNAPDYIAALVASAADFLKQDYDHLLFSYPRHSGAALAQVRPDRLPLSQGRELLRSRQPGARDVLSRAVLCHDGGVREARRRAEGKYSVSFQSRLGKDPWLKPYTDYELLRLAQEGKKRMLVICPAFVSDCLETIEEIGDARLRGLPGRERQGVHADSVHERASALDHGPGKDGERLPSKIMNHRHHQPPAFPRRLPLPPE